MVAGTTLVFEIAYRAKIIAMPKGGATIFGDLIGKSAARQLQRVRAGRPLYPRASHS